MVRKKIDSRIRTLIENGITNQHRSFFVIVGDHGREQVVNLHYMLSKASVRARPSVLWCYKKDLGFTSNRMKRMKKRKKQIKRGMKDADSDDPFDLFISSTDINYVYYKESHRILGQTFGCLVLQDFEAVTPNVLARTIETVEGGGIIVLLLKTMTSLRQLACLAMDVHKRFRPGGRSSPFSRIVARFNERFLLSLGSCENLLVVDDELNILPLSSHSRNIIEVDRSLKVKEHEELEVIKKSLAETPKIGCFVQLACTLEQANAILKCIDVLSLKTLRQTVAITAARGRGKSAALGVGLAAAVILGYSSIFVTSPVPENLKTVFEFLFKGLESAEYREHSDYEVIVQTNKKDKNDDRRRNGLKSSSKKVSKGGDIVIRVNIFRSDHRQTIQYIAPCDAHMLGHAELVVIDEAAAIPLPMVKSLLGPHLVFMASTINGYEGTGRSLSLKLVKELREQSNSSISQAGGRELHEISLSEPIRYAPGDPVEVWLNNLLCLDAQVGSAELLGCPHPDQCKLYYVNRDTLFSYHSLSEKFLQEIVALLVASHYKNSPNDLQLLSDAPAHALFVLLAPPKMQDFVDKEKNLKSSLPSVLAVCQVCYEGAIVKDTVMDAFSSGARAAGDLIPWTLAQQFQDPEFPSLSGVRVVRIATHPDLERMGYASRILSQLDEFFQGNIVSLKDNISMELDESSSSNISNSTIESGSAEITSKKKLAPLLLDLSEVPPAYYSRVNYMGVSFGITSSLSNFWRKSGYTPVYLRLVPNEITGEHTCIMLKALSSENLDFQPNSNWLKSFSIDFRKRMVSLLAGGFKDLPIKLALSFLLNSSSPSPSGNNEKNEKVISALQLDSAITPYDLHRLEAYSKALVDYHLILDLVPVVSRLFFMNFLKINLPVLQSAILLGIGLQNKTIENTSSELGLDVNQALALFNKILRKSYTFLVSIVEADIEKSGTLPCRSASHDISESSKFLPLAKSLEDELGPDEKLKAANVENILGEDFKVPIPDDSSVLRQSMKNQIKSKNIHVVSVKRAAAVLKENENEKKNENEKRNSKKRQRFRKR